MEHVLYEGYGWNFSEPNNIDIEVYKIQIKAKNTVEFSVS